MPAPSMSLPSAANLALWASLICVHHGVLARPLQHLELGHPDGEGGSWATTTSAGSVVIGTRKRRERERMNSAI